MGAVGVIGAGLAGLTAANQLVGKGVDVTVLEADDRPGGVIRTERGDGFMVEHGPNTLQTASGELDQLLVDLDLAEKVIEPPPAAARRYVVRNGQLVAVPTSLRSFLTTKLLSWKAKLRLLKEPFVRRRRNPSEPESVASFVRRRLGPEVLDYAVNPFVGGIFAGDPERLSVQHAFTRMAQLEEEHGSLLVGAVRNMYRRGDTPRRRMFSFHGGLQTLPDALARRLGNRLRLRAPVTDLHRDDKGWKVVTTERKYAFDAVIYAAPLHCLRDINFHSRVDLTPLLKVPYPPVTVLATGYARDAVAHPLDGFGLLVPEVEDSFRILGTLFSSTLFPNRSPDEDHVLLTTFVGGMRTPEHARLRLDGLVRLVQQDLSRLLGIHEAPAFIRRVTWKQAIPQYHLGYGTVQQRLDAIETSSPGLFLAGNYRRGVSVSNTVASGQQAAGEVLTFLDN